MDELAIDPRLSQANERTLLSWIRTGLALMAFGFVVERLAVWLGADPSEESHVATVVIGAAIVALGALCQILGAIRYLTVRRALLEERPPPTAYKGPVVIALLTSVVGVALMLYLLVARPNG